MLNTIVLFAVIFFVQSVNATKDCVYPEKIGNQADYYWRDYFGVVPKDAVPGGYTVDGNITYIGQLSHVKRVGVFPGTIYAGRKEGEICPGGRFLDETYVKILCSNPRNQFEWIRTSIDDSPLLTDYHWLIGGSEFNTPWYIGRVNSENEVKVGRVYNSRSPHKGLWICNKAGEHINFHSFELLVQAR